MEEEDFLEDELILRFEEMIEENQNYYFDTDEMEEIIGYYLDVGDLDFAEKALGYARLLHSNLLIFKIKELELLLELNKLKRSSILIKEIKSYDIEHLDFTLAEAKYWSLKKQHKIAIKFYKKALESGEEEDYIYHCLGNEHLFIGEVGKALYYFKAALELNIEDNIAFYLCLECFNEIHLYKESIEFLKQIIDYSPYKYEAWHELGMQYLKLKNYKEAVKAFDYALVIKPDSITSIMQMGLCYEKLNYLKKAIKKYKEALEYEDTTAYTYLKIAQVYDESKEYFKALKYYLQSIHEDPQLDLAWIGASEVYEKIGNLEEALHYATRAFDLDSINIEYRKKIAHLNIQLGYIEEALQHYEIILNIESGKFLNSYVYTELLILLGQYEKASIEIEKCIDKFDRAESFYQLSNCYFLLKDDSKGNFFLKIAKEKNLGLFDEMAQKYPILKKL